MAGRTAGKDLKKDRIRACTEGETLGTSPEVNACQNVSLARTRTRAKLSKGFFIIEILMTCWSFDGFFLPLTLFADSCAHTEAVCDARFRECAFGTIAALKKHCIYLLPCFEKLHCAYSAHTFDKGIAIHWKTSLFFAGGHARIHMPSLIR